MVPQCRLFVVGVAHTTNYASFCNGKHSSIHFLSHMKKKHHQRNLPKQFSKTAKTISNLRVMLCNNQVQKECF